MLKKFGLPLVALAGTVAFTAPKSASAQVGITVGPPYADPYYCANYYDPYNCPVYPYTYINPYPYGVYGGWGGGGGGGGGRGLGWSRRS